MKTTEAKFSAQKVEGQAHIEHEVSYAHVMLYRAAAFLGSLCVWGCGVYACASFASPIFFGCGNCDLILRYSYS